MDRVKTGVAGLDTMLMGGLLPARPYVVSGPTGAGKTVLAAQFLLEGLRLQEPCLLVTLDEPPIEVKSNIATFGWSLDRLKILDATPDVRAHKRSRSVIDVGTSLDVRDMEDVTDIRQSSQVRALEVTVHSVQKMIKQEFLSSPSDWIARSSRRSSSSRAGRSASTSGLTGVPSGGRSRSRSSGARPSTTRCGR
ncbi:MAG: hypothetical protein E6K19_04440 [Methanobacteriota archaeon]|nr:MAG: hypothetical protein E6K19_04440 [Euryarchaeota archaeon]